MTGKKDDPIAGKIERATSRLVQLQAQRALRGMREAHLMRMRERQMHSRRRGVLGDAVIAAGLGAWTNEEVTGLLLAGQEQFGCSETARKLYRQRAAQSLKNAPMQSAT